MPALALPPTLTIEPVHGGHWFTTIRFAPDGRLFATQHYTGRILVFPDINAQSPFEWATVPTFYAGADQGLHGLAFHPDFPDSPYIYVAHSVPPGEIARITRLTDTGLAGVDPVAFVDSLPCAAPIHMGGRLAFGPDRLLYLTTGDQMVGANAQDPTRPEGKILRFGLGGEPAPDNPFGADNPVAMIGVRNPYGLSFDPLTGVGYFSENGPECNDEVNILELGANYGWTGDGYCGLRPRPGTLGPLVNIETTVGPTGSAICRGGAFGNYEGDFFFGSTNDMGIYRVRFASGAPDSVETFELFHTMEELVLDMTMGLDGMLWVSTEFNIWRIKPTPQLGVKHSGEAPHFTAFPNPFSRQVSFVLPSSRIDLLELYDVTGRLVRRWSGPLAGTVTWDGHDDEGRQTPAGVYLARALSPGGTSTRRIVRTRN